jgi:hypothetical protein
MMEHVCYVILMYLFRCGLVKSDRDKEIFQILFVNQAQLINKQTKNYKIKNGHWWGKDFFVHVKRGREGESDR